MEVEKPKIEAIYSLSTMQQGILFHHLMSEEDQGFLHVQCLLVGDLDFDILQSAWKVATQRHAVLRTSVHWKNIEKPIQVVRPDSQMVWNQIDWSALSIEDQDQRLIQHKTASRQSGVNFEKGPLSKIDLIKKSADAHYLIWSCHHLLLDGWSSSIVLNDVFTAYKAISENKVPDFESIPSYKSYLNWQRTVDKEKAAQFWRTVFKDFSEPSLIVRSGAQGKNYKKNTLRLSSETTEQLNQLARNNRITQGTLFQGIWALVLAHYVGKNDVTFGTTVSGRSSSFPKIELMTGMFANVLPVRTVLDATSDVMETFKNIQAQQQEARNYEHFSGENISNWIEQSSGNVLFDTLFVFENFPWEDIESASIRVTAFESGLTTTYPLTLTIKTAKNIEIELLNDALAVDDLTSSWFLENIEKTITSLIAIKNLSVKSLLDVLGAADQQKQNSKNIVDNDKIGATSYVAPRNQTELELVKIWETVLGVDGIGVSDNYFELGGKSMTAISIFAAIEKKLEVKLSPVTLMENPTIEALAALIGKNEDTEKWKYLVPIRTRGFKKPLFCIHGGGAHVFFFNPLANALSTDRPVYALQPSGVFEDDTLHTSIEEMASDYAEEIQRVQPEGPYNIMVYCFSTAVGIEMSLKWKESGNETNMIIVDSLVRQEDFADPERRKLRIKGFLTRMIKNPFKAVQMIFINHINDYLRGKRIDFFGTVDDKRLEAIKRNLVRIYNGYAWKNKFLGKISLLLTEKADKTLNGIYIENWQKLAEKKVDVSYVNGVHHQLFEEPYATPIANRIEELMLDNTKKIK